MKAVVIERPHEIVFREVETPVCGPDDVLVASRRAGVIVGKALLEHTTT